MELKTIDLKEALLMEHGLMIANSFLAFAQHLMKAEPQLDELIQVVDKIGALNPDLSKHKHNRAAAKVLCDLKPLIGDLANICKGAIEILNSNIQTAPSGMNQAIRGRL